MVVARQVRGSAWFKDLVGSLCTAIGSFEGQRFGFMGKEKLSRTLLALICGLAMGYRSGKQIADVIEVTHACRKDTTDPYRFGGSLVVAHPKKSPHFWGLLFGAKSGGE